MQQLAPMRNGGVFQRPRLTLANPIDWAKAEARASRTARLFLELGVFLALTEGLLRRLFPDYSVLILLAKFLYFPMLYVAFWPLVKRGAGRGAIPGCVLFWLAWGTLLSLFMATQDNAAVHLIGTAINLGFVPVAWLAAGAYPDHETVANLMKRLTIFSAAAGAFALVQSRLPSDHFLNVAMDFERDAYSQDGVIRVTSTFQHCNIFGSFAAVALLPAVATLQAAKKGRERALCILALGLIYVGGTCSGSRMAAVAALPVLGVSLIRDAKAMRSMMLGGVAAVGLLIIVAIIAPDVLADALPASDSRAFDTNDLIKRTFNLYYEEHFLGGWMVSGGIGLGWGPYTMGVAKYVESLNLGDTDMGIHLESGYGILIAQLGIVGLLSFLFIHIWLGITTLTRRTAFAWIGTGVTVWSVIANIPLSLFEISVLAIPLWLLLGVSLRSELRLTNNMSRTLSIRHGGPPPARPRIKSPPTSPQSQEQVLPFPQQNR